MARAFVSPMGDPTFSNAAASLAEALFPSAATQARAKMLGAQYHGQLANNEQTNLENVGLQRTNDAYDSLGSVITDPRIVAILRAGGGNAAQLSDAIGNFQKQGFRDEAFSRADAAGYGVNAPLISLANGPVQFNQIDDGYQLDKYMAGGGITATGKTNAQIATEGARADQFRAGAAQNYAQAGAANALADQRRAQTADPGKYGKGGKVAGGPKQVSAADSKMITSEIFARIPKGAKYSEADVAEAIALAESKRSEGAPIGTSVAQAFDTVFGLDNKGTGVTRSAGVTDGLLDWYTGAKIPTGEVRMERKPQPAATTAAPAPTKGAATSVPPPAQRERGAVYATPKGNLKWTGTGWVKP